MHAFSVADFKRQVLYLMSQERQLSTLSPIKIIIYC